MTFTASDIIAIVAIIVGPVIGFLTAGRLQKAQADAQLERERRSRVSANRAATYVDVMEQVYRQQDWVDRTLPLFKAAGDPDPPAFPTDEELRKLNARTAAYGSNLVRERLVDIRKLNSEFRAQVWMVESSKNSSRPGSDLVQERKDLEDMRTKVREAVKELSGIVNRELSE